jgi:hypothetical protein
MQQLQREAVRMGPRDGVGADAQVRLLGRLLVLQLRWAVNG